jgi:hypothetical protein
LILLVLGGLSNAAFAALPRITSATVANPSFSGVANTMMYDVTVTVDGAAADTDHSATVGFTSSYTTCMATPAANWKWAPTQVFDTTTTRTWRLWNFQPGTTYYYKVRVGMPGGTTRTRCGTLSTTAAPTPTVPEALAALEFQYSKSGDPIYTKYILMETDDCGGSSSSPMGASDYMLALDPVNETIVWYLDIPAVSGIPHASGSGWRYQPGTGTTTGRMMMIIDHHDLLEWTFDGNVTSMRDFAPGGECDGATDSFGPCIHHDAFRSDATGRTYVLGSQVSSQDGIGTDWEDVCGSTSNFIDDGYFAVSAAGRVTGPRTLMGDYGWDPLTYGGPNAAALVAKRSACEADTFARVFDPAYGLIDWTHANALSASRFDGTTEVLDMSLKEWDAVIRINGFTGARIWTLAANAADSDWTLAKDSAVAGRTDFGGQHDAHALAEDLMLMFDNIGSPMGSRVLRLTMDESSMTATIDRSWAMIDGSGSPLICPVEGSAEIVPGSSDQNVLANCNDENKIAELNDSSGATGTAPPLVVSFPSDTDFCSSGGPTDVNSLRGWHRAFPVSNLGAF